MTGSDSACAPPPPDGPLLEFARLHHRAKIAEDPSADYAILATLDPKGVPCTRTLTLRHIDAEGIHFRVNSRSPKVAQLQADPRAEIIFLWSKAPVQIRVRGHIGLEQDADAIAAWKAKAGSSQAADLLHAELLPQSSVIGSRAELMRQYARAVDLLQARPDAPPTVATLKLIPHFFEFWIGSLSDRMHDRRRCELKDGAWSTEWLVP